MACSAIQTGNQFLSATLAHIDCQAQTVGSFGFAALSDPSSQVFIALSGLLAIFIALFGIRLLLGEMLGGGSVVSDIIRLGIVLTLATSWPAWRILGYDLILNGPAEVAQTIGMATGLSGDRQFSLIQRLQGADDRIVLMTIYGTGRLTGGTPGSADLGDNFEGIALADLFALGIGRTAFLAGAIAPYAIVRIAAGFLVAVAPLMAGFLLFAGARGLFVGWLRGLFFCAFGSLALLLLQAIEMAAFEPWVSDVVSRRSAGTLTPSAPTELLVLALAFCVLNLGMLFLIARVAFYPSLAMSFLSTVSSKAPGNKDTGRLEAGAADQVQMPSRAYLVTQAIEATVRREAEAERTGERQHGSLNISSRSLSTSPATHSSQKGDIEALGSSYRRTARRASVATERRDRT